MVYPVVEDVVEDNPTQDMVGDDDLMFDSYMFIY